MRTLKFLLQKEFRQIFRNPSILRMIIALPIIQLVVLPLAADFEIKNINISIVDHDRSEYSKALTEKIIASGYFNMNDFSSSYKASYEEFQKDKSDLILEIPQHFEKNLIKENGSQLFIAVNAINGTKALVGSSYLSQIINNYNTSIRTEFIESQNLSASQTIEITTLNWFNPYMKYATFMVPGILVFLITMIGTYMCSLNIVKEKEVGTIEQINVTPIKKHHFILGKLIPFWIIGMFVFSLGLFGVARIVYNIVPLGSILLIYGYLSIYLIAVLGVGLIISTYSNTQQQAMSLAFFVMMIFLLMGGLFTSIDSMPEWAKWISRFNPVTYFIEVMRMVVLKGSGFADIQKHFIVISIMAVVFNTWAILNYRKTS